MSTYSMTGFGEGKAESKGNNAAGGRPVEIMVEMKSVNHRFLDVVCKLPPAYAKFEPEVVRQVKSALRRGRVEVYVSRKDVGEAVHEVRFNKEMFSSYLDVAREIAAAAGLTSEPSAGKKDAGKGADKTADKIPDKVIEQLLPLFISRREVLELVPREVSADQELDSLLSALGTALEGLSAMREREGRELAVECRRLLDSLEAASSAIEAKAKATPAEFKERLRARLDRLHEGGVDDERLNQELAILADRIDITEELTRLQSHLGQARALLNERECGRKFEFLLQEIGREVNTIGSKAQNSEVANLVVDAKATTEKLREQVQNIE